MNVVVLGSGGWGTALALLLLENGHNVTLWTPFEEEAAMLREKDENPLLPGVPLAKELTVTSDLSCLASAALTVVAVPSFFVRETAKRMKPLLARETLVVSVSKGVEPETSLRLSQVIRSEIGEGNPIVVLSGPSHAEEVGRGIPTACVASCEDAAAAEAVQDAFMNGMFRVYVGTDVVGAELGGALKNIIALCCGMSDGLGLGDNTKAMLMTRGLAEMVRLGTALGARKETFMGLTGVGDLIVTCTSMHSRNRRAGILIGKGSSPDEAVREVGAVVEGYYAASAARVLARNTDTEMPIVEAACRILYEGADLNKTMHALMERPRRREGENL